MTHKIGDHAVVLGASMAGLLAARVLAQAYERVTLVDRDATAQIGEHRRGVPQGRHVHGLLARGQQILEELFPGLTAELVARGVPAADLLADVRWYLNGHRLRQADSGLTALCATRPMLEGHLRARVAALPNVTRLEHFDIVGLLSTPDARRVTGARVLSRADGSTATQLPADLVIDATGRGSRMPAWLQALGYQPPAQDRVPIDLRYATRSYRLSALAPGGDLVIVNAATPEHPRGGILQILPGGRAMVTLVARLGAYPPTDPAGFLAFARSLQFPDIYQAIRDAEPLDEPVGFRFPASVRRRYERLHRLPDGVLVIGDAVCSLNPIFAQGMSVAALEALVLREQLARGTEPDPHRYFLEITPAVDAAWNVAVGADLAFPGVEGRRTVKLRLVNRYMRRLHAAAVSDAAVARAFIRVAGLVDSPARLLRPRVALRVLRHALPAGSGRPAGFLRPGFLRPDCVTVAQTDQPVVVPRS